MTMDKYELEKNFHLLNSGPARIAVAQNSDIFGDFTFHSDGNASQMLWEISQLLRLCETWTCCALAASSLCHC